MSVLPLSPLGLGASFGALATGDVAVPVPVPVAVGLVGDSAAGLAGTMGLAGGLAGDVAVEVVAADDVVVFMLVVDDDDVTGPDTAADDADVALTLLLGLVGFGLRGGGGCLADAGAVVVAAAGAGTDAGAGAGTLADGVAAAVAPTGAGLFKRLGTAGLTLSGWAGIQRPEGGGASMSSVPCLLGLRGGSVGRGAVGSGGVGLRLGRAGSAGGAEWVDMKLEPDCWRMGRSGAATRFGEGTRTKSPVATGVISGLAS